MTDKLLTPEEIRAIPFYKLTPDKALPYTLLEKQIDKAEPLIKKAERERIASELAELYKHNTLEGLISFVPDYILTLRGEL